MQIQPETIIWNQPAAHSVPVRKSVMQPTDSKPVFRLEQMSGDRINGSIPVWSPPETPEEKITASLQNASDKAVNPAETAPMAAALAETGTPQKTDAAYSFLDVIDMINPLQHIPFVSTIYRQITGDEMKPVSRVVGDAAFGGPIGAAVGLVNALVQDKTGKDVADNMIASLNGSKDMNDTTIAVANLRSPYNA